MARMTVKCPSCGAQLSVPATQAKFTCPQCKKTVRIARRDAKKGDAAPPESKEQKSTSDVTAPHDLADVPAWQVLMFVGWCTAVLGAVVSFGFGIALLNTDTDPLLEGTLARIQYETAGLKCLAMSVGSLIGGLVNHVFCRLCQHVQEIRDELKKLSERAG